MRVSWKESSLVLLPNAVAFSGAYLAGPGFTAGAGTLVSPSVVVLGPLPMFPMLAALPDAGEPPAWTAALVVLPVVVAAVAAARAQQVAPTEHLQSGVQRRLRRLASGAIDGNLARRLHEHPRRPAFESRAGEVVALGEEAHRPVDHEGQEDRIADGEMVAREDGGSRRRDVRPPDDPRSEDRFDDRPDHDVLHDPVEHQAGLTSL